MCDERERLIGYLYDEVDAAERRHVEAHLNDCPECRREIAGLASTRQDLLAWSVPKHEPIWRPMAPPRAVPPVWKQIPTWAMAAAATAVLASGLMGGLAVRWLTPVPVQQALAVGQPAVGVLQPGVAIQDTAAVEARILDRVRAEMRRDLIALTARTDAPSATVTPVANRDAVLATLTRRLGDLERWRTGQDDFVRQQAIINYSFDSRLGRVSTRARAVDNELEMTRRGLQLVSMSGGADSGR